MSGIMIDQDELDKKFVEAAKKDYPEDAICGFCGKTNDNADDAGFWYYQESLKDGGKLEDGRLVGPSLPACKACAKILHPVHVKYWGEGDR